MKVLVVCTLSKQYFALKNAFYKVKELEFIHQQFCQSMNLWEEKRILKFGVTI